MNSAFSISDLQDRISLPCALTNSKRLQVVTSVLEITSQALAICSASDTSLVAVTVNR